MSLKTVIDDNRTKINNKLFHTGGKSSNSWNPDWEKIPDYSAFQKQTLRLLDVSVKSNSFTDLNELDEKERLNLEETILTLLSLSLNFSDVMDYNYDEWLDK